MIDLRVLMTSARLIETGPIFSSLLHAPAVFLPFAALIAAELAGVAFAFVVAFRVQSFTWSRF
jgi:hypothetical protein